VSIDRPVGTATVVYKPTRPQGVRTQKTKVWIILLLSLRP